MGIYGKRLHRLGTCRVWWALRIIIVSSATKLRLSITRRTQRNVIVANFFDAQYFMSL